VNESSRRGTSLIYATILGTALAMGSIGVAAGQSPQVAASPVPATLSVEGAWARVSPMMDRAGAAYMVIHNAGTADDAFVSATSSAAAVVELHETVPDPSSGMMAMQPVVSIPVPAGGMAELKPGGYHVMLIDLVAPLAEGTTVDLELTFESGTVMNVTAPVQSGMPMGSPMPMGSTSPMGSAAPMGSPAP
jgi:copper(I)-binding protein